MNSVPRCGFISLRYLPIVAFFATILVITSFSPEKGNSVHVLYRIFSKLNSKWQKVTEVPRKVCKTIWWHFMMITVVEMNLFLIFACWHNLSHWLYQFYKLSFSTFFIDITCLNGLVCTTGLTSSTGPTSQNGSYIKIRNPSLTNTLSLTVSLWQHQSHLLLPPVSLISLVFWIS